MVELNSRSLHAWGTDGSQGKGTIFRRPLQVQDTHVTRPRKQWQMVSPSSELTLRCQAEAVTLEE